jgi:hypothetical protein
MRRKLLLLPLLLLLGCTKNYVNHPGSIDALDSHVYDQLITIHSVIETSKADLAANKFPAAISANVKTSLNDLIRAYDALDAAYLSYHASVGMPTAAQVQAVNAAVGQVQSAQSALTSARGGK